MSVLRVPCFPASSRKDETWKHGTPRALDSVTSYVWVHHVNLDRFPVTDYKDVQRRYMDYWTQAEKTYAVPYYPNVEMGWDPSPRTDQSQDFKPYGYPFTAVMGNNTPANFKAALQAARERLDKRPAKDRILIINAWNEWTESSYLEPDTVNGMAYLEAIKEVFGQGRK